MRRMTQQDGAAEYDVVVVGGRPAGSTSRLGSARGG